MEKITLETEVTSSELACVLGITGRNVRQLVEDGQLEKKDGRFLLCDSVQRYVAFKSRKEADDEEKRLEKARRTADVTMKASKAQIAKMEADELRGKMHRSEDERPRPTRWGWILSESEGAAPYDGPDPSVTMPVTVNKGRRDDRRPCPRPRGCCPWIFSPKF